MIMSMNEEFKDYSSVLTTNLKYFTQLSAKRINMFSKEDAEKICSIVPGIDDYELLFYEIQMLKSKIFESNNISDVLNVVQATGAYPRAQRVYQYLLTIPVSIASNERSFSKLKIIKNYIRTTMSDERLFYLMLCAIEKDHLDELNLNDLAKSWAKMKHRRIQLQ
jgi:hypothetical protein